jgi:hypothetical protein
MGARINYIFKDSLSEPSVALYSHWGETDWQTDIAAALDHARPRWTDDSYATRMMISYLIQDQLLDQHGFGIYAVNGPNYELGDATVVVDFIERTIYEVGSSVKVNWDAFVQAYGPKVLAEQTV